MTDPISNERLLPCPFCGAKPYAHVQNSDSHVAGDPSLYLQIVWCDDCGAQGPHRDTEAEAIAAWNRRQSPEGVEVKGLDIADTCDGVEQNAFEAWAAGEKYEMHEHPLHYIFLDQKTDAARMGWKAGISHARSRILSSLSVKEPGGVEPVAWFIPPDADGVYQQVSPQHYGDPDLVPLYASPPPKAVIITDEMVERACSAHWPGPWPGDRSGGILEARRTDMRAALTAALSSEAHNGREVE